MGEQAFARMSVEEYYAWSELQDERYEYVDGFPVRMMTGASRRHDDITFNILVALGNHLRGKPCRGFTADTAVATGPGRRRRPDAGIECGQPHDEDHAAHEPKLVVEVLSPSTREFDLYGKIDEYKTVESLDYILLVEPNAPQALLWTRGADRTWSHLRIDGLDGEIALSSIDVSLRLADIYEGVTFKPRPRLVPD